jgi:hypothetical protein
MNNTMSWNTIREIRNYFLKQSDWTQFDDVDMSDEEKRKWKEYRLKLRDITKTYRVPNEVVWPISPEIEKLNEQESLSTI